MDFKNLYIFIEDLGIFFQTNADDRIITCNYYKIIYKVPNILSIHPYIVMNSILKQ